LFQPHFRTGAAAFANAADLFVGRFAKRKNRFLKIGFFILTRLPVGGVPKTGALARFKAIR